jgi:hypothetical protein
VVCIIATKDALRALLWRPNRHARFGVEGRSVFSIASPLYAAVEKQTTGAAAWCRCGRRVAAEIEDVKDEPVTLAPL